MVDKLLIHEIGNLPFLILSREEESKWEVLNSNNNNNKGGSWYRSKWGRGEQSVGGRGGCHGKGFEKEEEWERREWEDSHDDRAVIKASSDKRSADRRGAEHQYLCLKHNDLWCIIFFLLWIYIHFELTMTQSYYNNYKLHDNTSGSCWDISVVVLEEKSINPLGITN